MIISKGQYQNFNAIIETAKELGYTVTVIEPDVTASIDCNMKDLRAINDMTKEPNDREIP